VSEKRIMCALRIWLNLLQLMDVVMVSFEYKYFFPLNV